MIINIDATERHIDHQQTLFLSTNLVQRFPLLQMLALTSSGLMQINSSVFSFLTNLKTLNLTSNKLKGRKIFTACCNLQHLQHLIKF